MADTVVPQEYGTTIAEKRSVGVKICHGLLDKVKYDINVARSDNEVDMRYVIVWFKRRLWNVLQITTSSLLNSMFQLHD